MSLQRFALRVLAPMPAFEARPNDRILVRAGHAEPLGLVRILPEQYAALAEALRRGHVYPLNPAHSVREVIACLRSLTPAAKRTDVEIALRRAGNVPAEPSGSDLLWRLYQREHGDGGGGLP